jgi:hypothetical protein
MILGHANMKELRFKVAHGVWRVAFAFDPERQAILLVAGNKAGTKVSTNNLLPEQTNDLILIDKCN